MKLARLPRFPFELLPIVLYGAMLFSSQRIFFDSGFFNFVFVALVSVLPWISLSWALVFNRGKWTKPTVLFSIYVVVLSLAMVVMTWINLGPDRVFKDKDPNVIELFSHATPDGRIVACDSIANGARCNAICVYRDKRLAPGLWLRSQIFCEQIYDIDHFDFSEKELAIVTRGKAQEIKKVRLPN